FLTACSFCPNKLKVPDQAVGACLRCPKCGDYFTVVPAEKAKSVANPLRPPAAEERPAAPVETPSLRRTSPGGSLKRRPPRPPLLLPRRLRRRSGPCLPAPFPRTAASFLVRALPAGVDQRLGRPRLLIHRTGHAARRLHPPSILDHLLRWNWFSAGLGRRR